MMALNKDPDERPQGCAEFLRLLLAEFADTRRVEAQKEAQKRWGRFISDSILRIAAGATLLTIAAGLAIYMWGTALAK
jgi:hypothetical protein